MKNREGKRNKYVKTKKEKNHILKRAIKEMIRNEKKNSLNKIKKTMILKEQ